MTRQKIQPAAETTQPVENKARRSLLNGLWLTLSGLALAEIAWLVGSFLKPLKSNGSPDQPAKIIDAGPTDRFAPNTVTAFPQGRFYLACLKMGDFWPCPAAAPTWAARCRGTRKKSSSPAPAMPPCSTSAET